MEHRRLHGKAYDEFVCKYRIFLQRRCEHACVRVSRGFRQRFAGPPRSASCCLCGWRGITGTQMRGLAVQLACARRRCRWQPCLNASHRLCCSRSQTLSSILPCSRPGLPKTPANWLSDLCDHLGPSTARDTIFPHTGGLRSRCVIHGHFRATSKIAYIHK